MFHLQNSEIVFRCSFLGRRSATARAGAGQGEEAAPELGRATVSLAPTRCVSTFLLHTVESSEGILQIRFYAPFPRWGVHKFGVMVRFTYDQEFTRSLFETPLWSKSRFDGLRDCISLSVRRPRFGKRSSWSWPNRRSGSKTRQRKRRRRRGLTRRRAPSTGRSTRASSSEWRPMRWRIHRYVPRLEEP